MTPVSYLLSPFERIGQCSTCPKLLSTAPARGDRLVPLNNHLLFFEMFQILVRYASQQIQRLLQPRRRHGRKNQKSVHHEWQGRPRTDEHTSELQSLMRNSSAVL